MMICWNLIKDICGLLSPTQLFSIFYRADLDTDVLQGDKEELSASHAASSLLVHQISQTGSVPELWWLPRCAIDAFLNEHDTHSVLTGRLATVPLVSRRMLALAAAVRLAGVVEHGDEHAEWSTLPLLVVRSLEGDRGVSSEKIVGFLLQCKTAFRCDIHKPVMDAATAIGLIYTLGGAMDDLINSISSEPGRSLAKTLIEYRSLLASDFDVEDHSVPQVSGSNRWNLIPCWRLAFELCLARLQDSVDKGNGVLSGP